ncbi:MAG: hypothetical protein R2795_23695 [Saprospiraceae bacterium]
MIGRKKDSVQTFWLTIFQHLDESVQEWVTLSATWQIPIPIDALQVLAGKPVDASCWRRQ